MGAIAQQFLLSSRVGDVADLGSAISAAVDRTTILRYPALAVGQIIQARPGQTNSNQAGTAADAGSAWNGIGWRTGAIVPLNDSGILRAQRINYSSTLRSLAALTAVTLLFSVYIDNVQIGRGAAGGTTTALAANVDMTLTGSIDVAETVIPAGARLVVAIFVQATNAAASTTDCQVVVNATTEFVQPLGTFSITAARTATDTAPAVATAARSVSQTRQASDAAPTSADTATRTQAVVRTASDSTTQVASAARSATFNQIARDVAPAMSDAASRRVDYARAGADAVTTPVDSALRTLSVTRVVFEDETVVPVATAAKIITFGRTATHYFVPTDPPVTDGTRKITGVVRLRATGEPWLGVARLVLIRDSDGLRCATTTSSSVDGSYTFVRNRLDPETYSVFSDDDVNGTYEQDQTATGLVPV